MISSAGMCQTYGLGFWFHEAAHFSIAAIEIGHAGECAAAQALVTELFELAFYQVDPRARGGCEVQVPARPARVR